MPERLKRKMCCIKYNIITTTRGTFWTVSGQAGICVSYEDGGGASRRRKEVHVRTHDESAREE